MLTLVIGNKNYSSWSLRPWLALRQAGIPFEEVRVPLYTPESLVELRRWSPSGLVPPAPGWRPEGVGFPGHLRIPPRALSRASALARRRGGPGGGPAR
jgi:hypothetical protein